MPSHKEPSCIISPVPTGNENVVLVNVRVKVECHIHSVHANIYLATIKGKRKTKQSVPFEVFLNSTESCSLLDNPYSAVTSLQNTFTAIHLTECINNLYCAV